MEKAQRSAEENHSKAVALQYQQCLQYRCCQVVRSSCPSLWGMACQLCTSLRDVACSPDRRCISRRREHREASQEAEAAVYLKMLLGLSGVHRHGQAIRTWWGIQSWVLVQVGQQQRGTDRWPIVQTRTSVTVSAGSARRCKRCQYEVIISDHRQRSLHSSWCPARATA